MTIRNEEGTYSGNREQQTSVEATSSFTATTNEETPLLPSDKLSDSKAQSSRIVRLKEFKDTSQGPLVLENWTDLKQDKIVAPRERVGSAAFLLCDAILGQENEDAGGHFAFDPYESDETPLRNKISISCRRIVSILWVRKLVKSVAWLLVFLSFFEPPGWCKDFASEDGSVVGCEGAMNARGPPAEDPNSDVVVEYYPNTGTLLVTTEQEEVIELVFVFIILIFVLLGIARDGMSLRIYFRDGPRKNLRFLRALSIVALLVGQLIFFRRPFRHLFRIILAITLTGSVQREFRNVWKMMPEIFKVLALLFILVVFYGWIGVMAFYDHPQGEYFSNLLEAVWTLWICITTANYPDVMMVGYNENRLVALYFVSFMIITFFFMMNVILASVVNTYDNLHEAFEKERENKSQTNLKHAFDELRLNPKDTTIDRETIMALLIVLNEDFPQLREIPEDEAKILFGFLDKDGTDKISEEEFMDFCNVMLLKFEKASLYRPIIEHYCPHFYKSKFWQAVIRYIDSPTFEITIDIVLVLNAVIIGIQSYPILIGETVEVNPHVADGQIDTIWEAMETAFTIFYCFEMLFKILVKGWRSFCSSMRNLFDFLITALSVVASIYVYYPNDFSDSRLIRYIVMMRVLRLSRLLVAMKQFQVIGNTCVEILPAVSRVFILLFCIMYLFSTLGVILFGGMISRDPSNPLSYLVLDTDFSDSDYWANNFNDLLGGMNVLFNLLVINNWTECEAGFEAVTQSKWTRLFFLAFHIAGVIMVNNVVIAIVINQFIDQWDKQHEYNSLANVEGEAIIVGRHAIFNAREITGTKTGATGDYVARVRRTSQLGQHAFLRRVFSRGSSGGSTSNSERQSTNQ